VQQSFNIIQQSRNNRLKNV